MPRIDVSDRALAGLRALRQRGDETDDALLRRLLDRAARAESDPGARRRDRAPATGFVDATYGIHFPEGFAIFRTYKGRPFSARVEDGRWRLDADGRAYESLNQLSQAVIDGNENAWMFWFFRDPAGTAKRIAELRDPAAVQRRPRRRRRAVAESVPHAGSPEPIAEPEVPRPPPDAPVPTPAERRPPPATPPVPTPSGGGMAWEPATVPRRR